MSASSRYSIPDYAELWCLSNFSFLRGASHPHELVERAQRQGYRALALTDECSLAGIVLGAWLGIRFGTEAGALLHLDEEFAAAGGFLAVFVVVLIAVAIVGRLLRKVFHFAGFGIPDHLLGVAVSAAKTLLILGLLFSAFESLNKDHTLAEEKTLDRSVCYRPMIRLADSLFPLLEWAKEQVSIDEQELWSDNSPER